MKTKLTIVVAAVCLWPVAVSAQTLFSPETFGDGGAPAANGWTVGNSGSVDADAGDAGAGDHAINYGTTSGFHFLHPQGGSTPNADFLGDYTAAGATGIRFKARHTGIGDDVFLRATMFLPFNGDVDWAMSAAPLVLTANDTTWQTYELSLLPADLVSGGDNSPTAAAVLANVAQVGLRHDPAGTGPENQSFVSTLTNVYFDDVELVPEPTSWVLMLLCACGLAARRR